MPSFAARDDAGDVWKDGVGPVRVVRRDEVPVTPLPMDKFEPVPEEQVETEVASRAVSTDPSEDSTTQSDEHEPADQLDESPVETTMETAADEIQQPLQADSTEHEASEHDVGTDDVIVLYVVADRGHEMKGEQILGAAIATHLEYGDMNIFHRRDGRQKVIFSMANMMEPGTFDYEQMHELKTRGVSLFIQLGLCDDPVEALDDMLVCAHTLATMLNARMCDADRRLLNETVARALREKARYYHQIKQQNPAPQDS